MNAEQRALVGRLVLDRAAAIVAVQRRAEERERELWADLAERDHRLRTEIREHQLSREELDDRRAELERVIGEREALFQQLAESDRQFGAEIGEYRRQVASIAGSPDPRKREALARYAEGDREGGFEALVAIQRAETKAVAAGWREIGALALDRKDRGEMSTTQVISVFAQAQRIDPEDTWGWIFLRRLYQEAGLLEEAHDAAQQSLSQARGDRDRSVALNELGDAEMASGDLAAARASYTESLEIARGLAAANPTSASAERDVSVSLNKLGDVAVAAGDLASARESYSESLEMRRRLAAANPTSASAERDLIVSHAKLAQLPGGEHHWVLALRIAESLREKGQLAPRDAWMIEVLRQRVAGLDAEP